MMLFTKRFTYTLHKEQSGLSLVSTLWILTILSILAAQLLYSIHIEQRTQRNFLDRAKYHYAARAGFEWTLAVMRADQTPFDSLGESWAEPLEGQVEDGVRVGNFLNYQVTITDEASKVNINTADAGLISNLLAQAGASPDDELTQELANAIVEGQPYRTVRDLARVEGMTSELLYGTPQQTAAFTQGGASTQSTATSTVQESSTTSFESLQNTSTDTQPGLVDLATIYSLDASTDPDGQQLVNVNTGDAEQLTQINTQQNQPVFSQAEAESLIQQRDFDNLAALVDVQAVSDELFNNIQNQITTEDSGENQENEETNNRQVNINTADVEALQSLQGIDQGIAERIINHRDSQGIFQNTDAIKEVTMLTQQEFIGIVDKITLQDGDTRSGLININTAPAEVLALLPGMDPQKAQAIVERREQDPPDDSQIQSSTEEEITGNPFTNISQLSEVEGIDFGTFREVVDWVTYRSHGYRIEANGVDAAGKIISTCVGIINRTGDQVVVQYWRQD
jgi:DNA uptake protein ComE-like DNA-binding protein